MQLTLSFYICRFGVGQLDEGAKLMRAPLVRQTIGV